MVDRLIAAIVARSGTLFVERDRLICRLPKGESLPDDLAASIMEQKPAILAALTVASLEQTVRHILALTAEERDAYRMALAHDLAALAAAETALGERPAEALP
ncbi:MAG: hypothetical protein ACRDJW_22845 [Thermomicrobiales bacterium]